MSATRYVVLEYLGEGGMARAHLARAESAGGVSRLCVLKTIRAELSGRPELREAFFDEARIAHALQHGALVSTFDFGERDGELFLAMEWCDAGDMDRLMQALAWAGERMPLPVATHVMSRVLDGLHAAHTAVDPHGRALDLVHRDVSPGNILLTFRGEVKLADFGIARAADRWAATQAGRVKGKPGYLAPEQARGEPASRATDVFACGIVLWEMVTGRRLFEAASTDEIVKRVREARVPRPDRLREDCPPRLVAIILRALAADPAERFPDAATFRAELGAFLAESGWSVDEAKLAEFLRERLGEAESAALRARAVTPVPPVDAASTPTPASETPAPRRALGLGVKDIALVAAFAAASALFAWMMLAGGGRMTRRPTSVEPAEPILPVATPTAATAVFEAGDKWAGALITLDGRPLGFAPLRASAPAAGGKTAFRAEAPGMADANANLIFKAGREKIAPSLARHAAMGTLDADEETRVAGLTLAPGESLMLPAGLYRLETDLDRVETGEGRVRYVRVGDASAANSLAK